MTDMDHAGHDDHHHDHQHIEHSAVEAFLENFTSAPIIHHIDSIMADPSGPVEQGEPNSDGHSLGSHHDHSSNSTASLHKDMDMAMAFHFGWKETILFEFWKINGIAGLLGSMIGIFLISMLYEGLKVFREYLLQRSLQFQGGALNAMSRDLPGSSAASSNNGLRVPLAGEGDSIPDALAIKTFFRPNPFSISHSVQTILHMVQMMVSYLLMLIFMTYNVWLCLAVVLGAGCGYYAFGWRKRTIIDINEHCH